MLTKIKKNIINYVAKIVFNLSQFKDDFFSKITEKVYIFHHINNYYFIDTILLKHKNIFYQALKIPKNLYSDGVGLSSYLLNIDY